MKKMALLAGVVVCASTVSASSDTIRKACLRSDREAASRSLCHCIQKAADVTLTRKDQKLASTFFKDPHRAQEVRQSDRRSYEVFWKRYKTFRKTAEVHCSGT